ncbi:MAG: Card1-like endonuclease domain-containing protein [Chromatiales bacterium]
MFPSERDRFFVNGGWFEIYVYDRMRRLLPDRPIIQDLAHGVHVQREVRGKPVRNELDVAFLAGNRLHVIECKTRQWNGSEENGPGAEALYKLDSLRDLLGGLQAKAMLVSYQNLPDHDRRRAADLEIGVCAGNQVQRLSEFLREWLR